MPNRRRQIKDYAKEATKAITLSIPISQWQMLETFAEATHRPISDVVSDVFSDTALVSIRRMLAANAKPSKDETAASGLPDLAAAKLTPPATVPPEPPPPKAVSVEPSARRPAENSLVDDPLRPETPRGQEPTNPGLANPSRPPQAPTTLPSAVSQPVPSLNRGEPLLSAPLRPVIPSPAKPPAGDSEWPASAADSTPRSSHANE